MTKQLPKLLKKQQRALPKLFHLFFFILSSQAGGLRNDPALCDSEGFEKRIWLRLTWVGGTGEGWWEVDFSRAFRRLSNLKMAI